MTPSDMWRRRVIVVTDGDPLARRALVMAAKQIHARVISRSAGNPTPLTGSQIVGLIKRAKYDPVIVMVDDNGNEDDGGGEGALRMLLTHPEIEVIGALAVASNTSHVRGVKVDYSIDCEGRRVATGVNKDGVAVACPRIYGDTVDVFRSVRVPVIVGIGDVGKMRGKDSPGIAAPITTRALMSIVDNYRTAHAHYSSTL